MEATAVSKRQITPRITNRIFRRIWLGVRLGSVAAAFSRLCSVNCTKMKKLPWPFEKLNLMVQSQPR